MSVENYQVPSKYRDLNPTIVTLRDLTKILSKGFTRREKGLCYNFRPYIYLDAEHQLINCNFETEHEVKNALGEKETVKTDTVLIVPFTIYGNVRQPNIDNYYTPILKGVHFHSYGDAETLSSFLMLLNHKKKETLDLTIWINNQSDFTKEKGVGIETTLVKSGIYRYEMTTVYNPDTPRAYRGHSYIDWKPKEPQKNE